TVLRNAGATRLRLEVVARKAQDIPTPIVEVVFIVTILNRGQPSKPGLNRFLATLRTAMGSQPACTPRLGAAIVGRAIALADTNGVGGQRLQQRIRGRAGFADIFGGHFFWRRNLRRSSSNFGNRFLFDNFSRDFWQGCQSLVRRSGGCFFFRFWLDI